MAAKGHVLIVGASGVIGTAAIDLFGRSQDWSVTGLSRRPPVVAPAAHHSHLPVDLGDPSGCLAALQQLSPVTHLVYAAVREKPGLVAGWRDADLIAENGRMFKNVLDALVARHPLQHVIVLQGTKAYGGHHHPVRIPAREDRPRDDHANFYWLHEDHAREQAGIHGFAVTIFRPQVLVGTAAGVAMNPVLAIGAYSALCHALGRPFAYPGAADALFEATDATLLARAFRWAFDMPAASGETFNITNGDVFVPAHSWQDLGAALGHPPTDATERRLVEFFARADAIAAWRKLAQAHGLRCDHLPTFLGESHHYVDLLFGPRLAARPVPMLVSTIKLRRAGFSDCLDSQQSLVSALATMADLKLLPPGPPPPPAAPA
ncbi:NAD-dependent epimerase/dehydratase family protein [Sphingomonas sp. BIUV-7]|uniref:NAD-dependent epimerase/dehydratase family protein n=1 Tax=Sphingomonas natans TaxID=3063330 RepID=A0ABT8Y879_9SPHN|nr:NAD-dependent epimerase/dehydratase family protein [Sphingomonas sp. BIUV-7]MDO6414526.1 NAD-dependent epimerase/dehydratase family protein [Sphingomonas sp. BIUV-7]